MTLFITNGLLEPWAIMATNMILYPGHRAEARVSASHSGTHVGIALQDCCSPYCILFLPRLLRVGSIRRDGLTEHLPMSQNQQAKPYQSNIIPLGLIALLCLQILFEETNADERCANPQEPKRPNRTPCRFHVPPAKTPQRPHPPSPFKS